MAQTKKIAVLLSGCGVYDGAEIHEATLTLYAIKKNGGDYTIFAPDIPQHHVINHLTGKVMNEKRNVLVESARIARGQIHSLGEFKADAFDALILPGGFGAAKNLSTFAFDGAGCTVHPTVEKAIRDMVKLNKPVGALCIAPVILAKLFGTVELTIGNDPATAKAIEKMGARHISTGHGEIVVDRKHKLVSAPCYMLDATIVQIAEGAENVVKEILKLA
jgi:enhancing lycopene biosynthesis protein 2